MSQIFKIETKLMGCIFSLGVVSDSERQAHEWLQAGIQEIQRIEILLSEFIPHSITSQINQSQQNSVQIPAEVFQLIARCQSISHLTKGAFDISIKPLKSLYQFKRQDFQMPTTTAIQNQLASVGYTQIALESKQQTLQFSQPNMAISFAGIGKGYASDQVKKLWVSLGVPSGYINASGDLNAFGFTPEGTAWNIGISHPDEPTKTLLSIPLRGTAIATSGDYEQYFTWKGQRYAHTIHPQTGKPIQGVKSVSIVSPSAELSDALATAVFVKGVQKGLHFIEQLPQTHGIIVNENNQVFLSKAIQYETYSS